MAGRRFKLPAEQIAEISIVKSKKRKVKVA